MEQSVAMHIAASRAFINVLAIRVTYAAYEVALCSCLTNVHIAFVAILIYFSHAMYLQHRSQGVCKASWWGYAKVALLAPLNVLQNIPLTYMIGWHSASRNAFLIPSTPGPLPTKRQLSFGFNGDSGSISNSRRTPSAIWNIMSDGRW